MRTSTSLFVLPARTSRVLMAIVAPFLELRSLLAVLCHSVSLEAIPMHTDGCSLGQKAVCQHQGSGWQGGFLVPCLERGESQ
ncbi:MAG: hypothetical protein KME42_18855 [Tildeniella nuda ZEHNDER 1965/U140]|nr:hypothetical protein [Tildeniella nuda ZEHNDER 1965/U140]